MKKLALSLLAIAVLFQSCSDDDNDGAQRVISQTTGINITDLTVPTSYTFTRDGKTTVSFSGQTTRLKQVAAIGSDLNATTSTLTELENNFKNGEGFDDASLNGTGKKIRNKVANSLGLFSVGVTNNADALKADFDAYIANFIAEVQTPVSNSVQATKGNAGIADGNRNVNGDGLEYNQAFYKSLIGALVFDQAANHYFNRLDEDDFDGTNSFRTANDAGEVAEGKDYTTMEHHFDEAYGYVYGLSADDDILMQKYINRVEGDSDFTGTAQTIIDAFIIGRAAVAQKKYDIRDEAITVIRKELAKVIGIRAVYYLQQGKAKLTDRPTAFHDLSEGYGFVYSLQFLSLDGVTPLFTQTEVQGFIDDLVAGDGFWDVTETKLDEISAAIAAKFNFTVAQAGA
ncbi:DUF4856 domain-containing protein [Seonamhaeicola algicola]|uniref:DUF4856 domain-containing protein n=1 Tax=Seonamhaeicola algicola TaxID=1719036 RepID=A0A5C7ATI8_9FLAO|nr:DUF4856 domain-containing protein [Seonamhaeicola algicola]TXE11988.1 DUF4856 domain-containing protein [Seonamhaeicola algicola]